MTAELQKLANDPNFVVQFAVGDPAPRFEPQNREAGINLAHVFFPHTKRYVLKKAHLSADDFRIFDYESGHLVMVSHHPGKNPYDALDPLDLTNEDSYHAVAGGEWESVCDVSAQDSSFSSVKIRPKKMSRHGRQYIKNLSDDIVMNVGKMGKLKSMSIRDHFVCGQGSNTDLVYKCVADFTGRSVQIFNEDEELIAQMSKTTKALLLTAAFGSGSESIIDIAPGVDCSTILALVFGMKQVGAHCKLEYNPFRTFGYDQVCRPCLFQFLTLNACLLMRLRFALAT